MAFSIKRRSVLPGFGLGLGYSVFYLSLIVLLPLAAVMMQSSQVTWPKFVAILKRTETGSALWLSFFASFVAAMINLVFGLLVAWVLVRYRFYGRRLLDALVDLPFALPTAVAGIALTTLYSKNGWAGQVVSHLLQFDVPYPVWERAQGTWWPFGLHYLDWKLPWAYRGADADWHFVWKESWSFPWPGWRGFAKSSWPLRLDWHTQVASTPIGVTMALTFIGLPFVVRTVQPVLADLTKDTEEAAASLGARRWQTFRRVIFPELLPALVTGFALAFARAIGEYGSVIFIAGTKQTTIAPLLIMVKLDKFDYAGAATIAVIMLALSFVLLLTINLLQRRLSRRGEATV